MWWIALASDEHRRFRRRDLASDSIHLLHRGARTDEATQPLAVALAKLPAEVLGFDAEVAPFDGAFDGDGERVEVDGLGEVVLRRGAHRLHRRVHIARRR